MTEIFIQESVAILTRTPGVLNALLRDLPETWYRATEGPETWSPYDCLGHLIHGEKTDWMPRLFLILKHGERVPFEPFDRFAQFRDSAGKSLPQLLQEFASQRERNLQELDRLHIGAAHLKLTGTHPDFGRVTLKELIATWVVHDLNHLNQANLVMAKRYGDQVGPWVPYLSILNR
jgi:hypothetical protein